jgi:hypothetical protein
MVKESAPSILNREGAVVTRTLKLTGSPSLEQFSGIAIPIFGSSPMASGGSGEGGRGIGEENLGLIALRRENEPTAWESVRQGLHDQCSGGAPRRTRDPMICGESPGTHALRVHQKCTILTDTGSWISR